MTDLIPQPKFSDGAAYREWLEHPRGYRASPCFHEKAGPPREDWPVDTAELIARNRELANLHLAAAARFMREVMILTGDVAE